MLELESELIDIFLTFSRDRKMFWFKFGNSFRSKFKDHEWWLVLPSKKLFFRKTGEKAWLLIEGLPDLEFLIKEIESAVKNRRLEYRGWDRKELDLLPLSPKEEEVSARKKKIEEIVEAVVT